MTWGSRLTSRPVFEWAGTNQHGDRYKIDERKEFKVARLESDSNNFYDMRTLVLLSHELKVPVHYDYEDGVAYIEVVSAEAI